MTSQGICYFDRLPLEIYYILQSFFINFSLVDTFDIKERYVNKPQMHKITHFQSWRNFLHTNKEIFTVPKHRFAYYNLNFRHSKQFINDVKFRSTLLNSIHSSNKQILLNIKGKITSNLVKLLSKNQKTAMIHGICLDRVFGLNLSPLMKVISNIEIFQCKKRWSAPMPSTETLFTCKANETTSNYFHAANHISFFYNISLTNKDLEMFKNAFEVNVAGCSLITDVSSLKNVHTLILANCRAIRDVSALSEVYYLDIRQCHGIRDISALDHVGKLVISALWNQAHQKIGLPNDNTVRFISLSDGSNLEDIAGFTDCSKTIQYISNMYHNQKIEILSKFKRLELTLRSFGVKVPNLDGTEDVLLRGCYGISLFGFANVLRMNIHSSDIEGIDFSLMPSLRRFFATNSLLPRKLSLQENKSIKIFDLSQCFGIANIYFNEGVQYVSLKKLARTRKSIVPTVVKVHFPKDQPAVSLDMDENCKLFVTKI